MKTCLIYGQNGLDLDVTLNLVYFYKKLGYKTVFSNKVFDTNLLVVIRAVDAPLELSKYKINQIHVYDYGGWNYDGFVKSMDKTKTYIFTTAETTKKHLVENLSFPENQIFIAFPPVETKLWIAKQRKRKFELVHIGNFKKNIDNDIVKANLLKCIEYFKVDVWGLWWENLNKDKYHGKIGLFKVSQIYASSQFAFGLMYPFQREVTFSGRFWHAPLNGCYLLSEKGLFTKKIPGVIETNYTVFDIEDKLGSQIYDRNKLLVDSKEYWQKQYQQTLIFVIPILENIEIKKRSIKYKIFVLFLIGINYAKFIFQRYELFRYLKK